MFVFRNDISCKLVGDTFCPIIPSSESPSVILVLGDLHSSALSGHIGVKELLKLA